MPLTPLSQIEVEPGQRAGTACGGNGWGHLRARFSGLCAARSQSQSKTADFIARSPTRPMFATAPASVQSERATPCRRRAAGREAGQKRQTLDGVAHAEAPSSKSGPGSGCRLSHANASHICWRTASVGEAF